MRLFAAIELDAAAQAEVARLLPARRDPSDGVGWVAADALHITLWFIGEIAESLAVPIAAALSAAAASVDPFPLTLGKLGVFPPRRVPSVLWVGAEDAACGCLRLIKAAVPAMAEQGVPAERRLFHAHATLARSRNLSGGKKLDNLRAFLETPRPITWWVRELVLFESVLSSAGPRYSPIARCLLGSVGRE